MKSLKFLLFGCLITLSFSIAAQQRVLDEIFTDVDIERGVIYGWNWSVIQTADDTVGMAIDTNNTRVYVDSLRMDVYMPNGDTSSGRPVILLSHSGTFLPQSFTGAPFGNRGDSALVEMCTRFAKRGFVAISFTYRKGWNPISQDQQVRTSTILNAVYLSMLDAKACVRFVKDAADFVRIDTNKIILGGSNSGAYTALLAGNLNRPEELGEQKFTFLPPHPKAFEPMIDTTIWGNYDGFGGFLSVANSPGPSSDVQMILSLGGNIGTPNWIDSGEPPVVAFHGVQDAGSPFYTAVVVAAATGTAIIEVTGPGDYIPLINSAGNNDGMNGQFCPGPIDSLSQQAYDGLYPFYGAGFEPWGWYPSPSTTNPDASKPRAMAYTDTIMAYFIPRAYRVLIDPNYTDSCMVTGIRDITIADVDMDIFPNPAVNNMTIRLNDLSESIELIEIVDVSGKMVKRIVTENVSQYTIERNELEQGVYFLNIKTNTGASAYRRVMFN